MIPSVAFLGTVSSLIVSEGVGTLVSVLIFLESIKDSAVVFLELNLKLLEQLGLPRQQ
jgi:hypothetical protein